jgi:hypothetical protein
MLRKSPSGALSPYYYKGGYFHGIHYGSYFNDMDSLRDMMSQEEAFIMNFPEKRRIMIDLYETTLTESMILEFVLHIKRMSSRIIKLAIAGDKKCMKSIYKALLKDSVLNKGQIYVCSDMEEGKTWLVSDSM